MAPIRIPLLALALVFLPAAAGGEVQSDVQQRCILEVNKCTGKVSKTTGKLGLQCLKGKATGKITTLTWSQCVDDDGGGRIARMASKTASGRAKKCDDAELPTLAFTAFDAGSTDAANQAAKSQTRSVVEDMLGSTPAVVVLKSRDPAAAACQAVVVKGVTKLLDLLVRESNAAKKDALALGAATDADLEAAFQTAWDSSPKVLGAAAKLVAKAEKKCEGIDPSLIFPARCARGTMGELAACGAERARCRACLMLEAVDGLALDCDALDDATANLSCS